MKNLLIILFAIFSYQAFAGDAVLLTSLKLKASHIRSLENTFNKALKDSGLKLVIHHNVDPKTLYQVMTSEETEAVVWVSHAAKEKEQVPGRTAEAIIMDVHGNDVKNFFTTIPKNLRFLGIVGCQSQSIIDGFRARGNYDQSPDLEIMSFAKKVAMQSGFKKTLQQAKLSLAKEKPTSEVIQEDNVSISITKENFETSPSLQSTWIEFGDRVLGIFDENEIAIADASIPRTIWNKLENKNIKHNRVLHQDAREESLGKLILQTNEPVSWKLFELRGKPLGGKHQHLYQYKNMAN